MQQENGKLTAVIRAMKEGDGHTALMMRYLNLLTILTVTICSKRG
jgi:hypothetical protein